MDLRLTRRLAYEGNYQKAIELLCDIVEKQDKQIQLLEIKLKEAESVKEK